MSNYTKSQALEVRRALADAPGITREEIADELALTVEQVDAIITDARGYLKAGRAVDGKRIGRRGS
jgi:orotate phosphoribosyltransferase-like protein